MSEEKLSAQIKFDSPTEEKYIGAYICQNNSAYLKFGKYIVTSKNWLEDSFFQDPEIQLIMNIVYVLSEKSKKVPQKIQVISSLEKTLKNSPALKEEIINLAKELYELDLNEYGDLNALEETIISLIKKDRAIKATKQNQIDIEKKNYDNLVKRMQDAVTINFDKDLGVSIIDVQKSVNLVKQVRDENLGCTWGSNKLDMILGKIMPGEIGVVCGVPGAGKTAWLGHFALENFKQGKKILLFSFEVSSQRLMTRLFKSFFEIKTTDLLEIDENFADEELRKTGGDIRIVDRPANSCSCDDMLAIIKDLKTYENWIPDLVLIDYILISKANDSKMDSSNTYKYYKVVTEEMRNLGKEVGVPIITCAQINREGMGEKGGSKEVVTSKNIAESRGVLDTADDVLIIQQTEKDKYCYGKHEGKYTIRIDKNRNGDNGKKVEFRINWTTLRIKEEREKLKL